MFTNLVGKSVAADTEFSDDVANSVDTGKLPKAPGAANEHGSTAYADVSKPKRQRRISSFQDVYKRQGWPQPRDDRVLLHDGPSAHRRHHEHRDRRRRDVR